MKIALSGGGTGGHVYPLLAIAEMLRGEFFYFGTRKGAEAKIVEGMDFIPIPAVPFPTSKKDILGFLKFLFVLPIGFFLAYKKLRKIRPVVLISSGGYVSVPVVLASRLLSIPILVHEQNLIPGRANRILSSFADVLGVSFPDTKKFLKGRVYFTGYPLRTKIKKIEKEKARKKLGLRKGAFVILVTGGSRGARSINRAVAKLSPKLLKEGYWIIHSTGIGSEGYNAYEDTKKILSEVGTEGDERYFLKEYIHEMEIAYSAADLVISRAGAGTVEEIKRVKIPAILVPKIGLPGEHQLSNAIFLNRAGVAEIAFEDYIAGLSTEVLFQHIKRLKEKIEEVKANFSKLSEEKPEIGIKDLFKNVVSGRRTKRKSFYLVWRGEKYPLIFSRNTISSSLFSTVRIKDFRGKIIFRVKDGKGILEGYGEIGRRARINLQGQELEFVEEEEEIREEIQRSFKGRFASSAFGILISRSFGFLREIFIGGYFGASLQTDIFAVALMVANFFRRVVGENTMDNAFLPTFLRVKHRGGNHWKLAYSVLSFFLISSLSLVILLEITIPSWFRYIAPGFVKKGVLSQGMALTRLMLPFLIIVSIAGWGSSLLKASDRFAHAEGSASFYSLGIIFSVVFLSWKFGIFSLGIGVLVGGVLQVIYLLFLLSSSETKERLGNSGKFSFSFQGALWIIVLLSLPILLDVSFSKLSDVVDKILATPLENGAVAALYFAAIVFRLPVNVIGNSINNVVLKDFSSKLASRQKEETLGVLYRGFELQFLTLLPATLFTLVFASPIIEILFKRGAFDMKAVSVTSACLGFYSLSIIAWGLSSMAGKIFSARLETHISMFTNASAIILNVILSIILVRTSLSFKGLALATSISLYFAAILRFFILSFRMKRDKMEIKWRRIGKSFLKWFTASLISVGSGYAFFSLLRGIRIISHFFSLLLVLTLSFTLAVVFFVLFYFMTKSSVRKRKRETVSPLLLPPEQMLDALRREPEPYREEMELRTEALLRSPNWKMRNIGVKLVEVFGYERFRDVLEKFLREEKVGFLRRNSARALSKLSPSEKSLKALIDACKDNYYEVRAEAARGIGIYGISSEDVKVVLYRLLEDGRFEVRMRAILSLASLFGKEIFPRIRRFYSRGNYKLRLACTEAICKLLERGMITKEEAEEEGKKIIDISEGFSVLFPIKEKIAEFRGK